MGCSYSKLDGEPPTRTPKPSKEITYVTPNIKNESKEQMGNGKGSSSKMLTYDEQETQPRTSETSSPPKTNENISYNDDDPSSIQIITVSPRSKSQINTNSAPQTLRLKKVECFTIHELSQEHIPSEIESEMLVTHRTKYTPRENEHNSSKENVGESKIDVSIILESENGFMQEQTMPTFKFSMPQLQMPHF